MIKLFLKQRGGGRLIFLLGDALSISRQKLDSFGILASNMVIYHLPLFHNEILCHEFA